MFENLVEKLKKSNTTLVFTEGPDPRILEAASRLKKEGILEPLLVGNPDEVKAAAEKGGFDITDIRIVDPANYRRMDELVDKMVELRKGKMTPDECRAALSKGNYFGTMLVKMGVADCLLGGATYSTADTVRPALQLVKAKPGSKSVSSCFLLVRERPDGSEEKYIMGDCAINIEPSAEELAETATVQVRFSKDGETASGSLSIYNTEDEDVNLGYITFNESMVRYAGERFLDIQLVLEDESGLKIPKSSVVEKEFYTVPQDYITQGGDSSQNGVLVQTDENTTTFEAAEVYYRDNETGLVYLDADAFKEGTVLVKPDSSETCTLGEKGTLQGVFNINKGYAEFTQVEILCENEEYYIVQSGNDYGLANYDHIALDGSDIHENEIIF